MYTIETSFQIPENIVLGLQNRTLERVGGVIREAKSKQVVTWLREGYKASKVGTSNSKILSSTSMLSESMDQALSTVGSIAGILNLAVTTMGFAIIYERLSVIEQQLGQAQELLKKLDYKVDLSFYANFRAALDLAINAFTMSNSESRKMSAMQAINRFLEAEQHYTKLADIEISNGSSVADSYLSTLCLAYVTEARCYLELEEIETARRRLQEGTAKLRPLFERHITTLLTSNPAAYLHPSLKGRVGLKQLASVYQWMEPELGESDVFEKQRNNIFSLAQSPKTWMSSLPEAICVPNTPLNFFDGLAHKSRQIIGAKPSKSKLNIGSSEMATLSPEAAAFSQLPSAMALMQAMVEDDNRLTMYESEIETVHKLGVSFQEWQQLEPSTPDPGCGSGLIYITIS